MTNLCTLMGIRHAPRTSHSPWTNGLVEVQNKNIGTHLDHFYKILLKTGHYKFICMLMHIILNHYQN